MKHKYLTCASDFSSNSFMHIEKPYTYLMPTKKSLFETSDGIQREEHGQISDPESDNAILRVQGSYSYTAPDGRTFIVRYIADDQGFRPEISESIGVSLKASVASRTRVGTPVITSLQGGNAIG
ncbi:hypothetical protein ILUMI_19653 [Ignelater luminosus]|uniref:Uncharacterized protein n=1 Tax=Ignelater luminosus TaxID=2038154 RepID=A0A8K0CFT4_IGNLU|nr:hypothetical protein ILUMI_19653 [Ignelater luminosus]